MPSWTQAVAGGGTASVGQAQFGSFGGYSYFTSGTPGIAPVPQAGDSFQLWHGGTLKEPTVFTVSGVIPNGTVNWYTFFLPNPQVPPAAGDSVISLPRPKNPRWLGTLGHVSGLVRSYACPGGPDTMTLLLRLPADYRTDAINPGRVMQVWRGASCVWEGKLDEPSPGPDGWTVTAHGAGQYGTDFAATYNTWGADQPVDQARARGMRWANPGIGNPSVVNCLSGTYSHSSWVFNGTDQLYTTVVGATWTCTFTGSMFQWWATTNSDHGIATISVDGGPPVSVDGYSPSLVDPALIYSSGALGGGTHTVVITNTGTNDASSSGTYVAVNYLAVNPGIWIAQQQDSGAETITAHLNLLITGGGMLWQVTRGNASTLPAGPWTLQVKPFPTDSNGNPLVSPDRLLICNSPVPRTIAADVNALVLRYQVTADIPATSTLEAIPATFLNAYQTNQASVAKHGVMEYYLDLSSAGVMSGTQALAIGQNILSRYVRASFAGPFTAGPGQVMNAAGTPVDLGCEEAGHVYQVMVTDAGYGGEVASAPLVFLAGGYSYDEDTGTATITPYQSVRNDLSSLIAALYPSKFLGSSLWFSVIILA